MFPYKTMSQANARYDMIWYGMKIRATERKVMKNKQQGTALIV